VTLSIATQSRAAAPPTMVSFRTWPRGVPLHSVYWLLGCFLTLAAGLMVFGKRRRAWVLLLAALGATLFLGACGGGGGDSDRGTPAGTYTITVTANSGSISKTVNLTLIVR